MNNKYFHICASKSKKNEYSVYPTVLAKKQKSLSIPRISDQAQIIICAHAFENSKCEKIFIPNNVICLAEYALSGSPNLKTVAFEEGSQLQEIDDKAFAFCPKLKTINIPPKNIKYVGGDLFFGSDKFDENPFFEAIANKHNRLWKDIDIERK